MRYRYCAALCKAWMTGGRTGRVPLGRVPLDRLPLARLSFTWLLAASMLLLMDWLAPARAATRDVAAVDHPSGASGAPGAPGVPYPVTYPDIAAAFRVRTAGLATPTPAIVALARRLTDGMADPHARALALSDWVRLHVGAAGADAPLSSHAARPAAAVLASLSGNGSDKAVLLQALLSAGGIDNTAALARLAGDATLPDGPTPATFDHLLVYLPALGLYLDPSANTTAAGYLPPALLGKPVLLAATGRFAMTPPAQAQSVRAVATIDVRRDGSAAFRFERTYAGALAEPVRRAVGAAPPAVRMAFVRQVAVDLGRQGCAALDDARVDAGGDVHVALSGLAERFIDLPNARQLATTYPHLSTVGDAVAALRGAAAAGPLFDCAAVDAEDEIRLNLPSGLRIARMPAGVDVIDGGVFYRAAYARQGNAVIVKRRFTFRSGRPTCTPAEFSAMRTTLGRVARDLGSQVVIVAR